MPIKYLITKHNALSYDAEAKEVTLYGQSMTEEYFREIQVVTMLNAAGTNHGAIVSVLEPMHIAGMSTQGYGDYSRIFAEHLQANRQAIAQRQAEAKAHQERIDSIFASPEEIEKAVAERKARQARNIAAFRKGDALF